MNIVVFTGAGISAEAGISTFRGSDGLWEKYRIEDVATPQAWKKNPKLVLDFYNQRRKQVIETTPTKAHYQLAELQKLYPSTFIITQNIDDLHERAGSNVVHLHGEIRKARSTADDSLIVDIEGWRLDLGDLCPLGSQLRPHVVWFGEDVPLMETAIDIASKADIFLVIGTSLLVYPAASLLYYVPAHAEKWIIDPNAENMHVPGFKKISQSASIGVKTWKNLMKL
ncbi:SIR2 family NAD-dependent protein deacylase [Thermaurantimonas aggregans]|nr:NAD-dependent deacylase [Thermaurantimonas aggregans]MCX8148245.1 NAD-dependent deacylase [Thermaurantimonas aggregans]